MPPSRLRLRLAGWSSLAFLAGLLILSVILFVFDYRQDDRRFTHELVNRGTKLVEAVRIEYAESPRDDLGYAVAATLAEWPTGSGAFALYGPDGRRLAAVGPPIIAEKFPLRLSRPFTTPVDLPAVAEPRVRLTAVQSVTPDFTVLSGGTTAGLDKDAETFALWLAMSTPLSVILSLAAGYVLSQRALRPMAELEQAIAGIGPEEFDRRLPVHAQPDELDRVAAQFNALLSRFQHSRAQSRRFLEQAAHQIRTPLTLVLGEAELALAPPVLGQGETAALRRIQLAAMHIRHRVEELLLLARAEAGERAVLTDRVELDGLALECAELMRGRASALGCRLELTQVEPLVVLGSESLLREAVVELLENACRHGTKAETVRLSIVRQASTAVVEVVNTAPDGDRAAPPSPAVHGLGLQVIRWITAEHRGAFRHERQAGRCISALYLPLQPIASQ